MKDFTVVLLSSGKLAIHKAGCRDIKIQLARHYVQNMWDSSGETAQAVMADELQVFDEQEQGYTEKDFIIAPCCD